MVSVALFTAFALVLGLVLFRVWRDRTLADERAAANEERAALAEAVQAIAHDLDNLFGILLGNLSTAHDLPPDELDEALHDVERAAGTAKLLVRALRGDAMGEAADEPVSGIVRVLVALHRRRGAAIQARTNGDLLYTGKSADAFRVIHNLLANAVREAGTIPGGEVALEVRAGELRITNPVRDASKLDDSIWTRGVSGARSSGLGLAIARESAARIGWRLRHDVDASSVCFVIEAEQGAESGKSATAAA